MSEKQKQSPEKQDGKTLISLEKQPERNQELKFKMELELFKGGVNDEIFLNNYLKSFYNLNLNSFDAETKNKFIEEMKIVVEELRGFDVGMTDGLRQIRESMSMGLEAGKDDNYYRSMIIGKKIQSRITVLQESIKTITGEKITIAGREYNKADYTTLKETTQKLDQANGLNIFAKLEFKPIATNYGELAGLFYQELSSKIANPQSAGSLTYKEVMEGLASIGSNERAERLTSVKLVDGKILNLFELYKKYYKNYKTFKAQNEIFQVGNKQLKKVTSGEGFGFNEQYHRLGYDKLEEVYADKLMDVEKMGVTDLVIMMRVLFSVIPVAGDMVGGVDDIKQANAGVNFDGSIQGVGENMLGYFTGVLGITVVGGTFGKVAKGPKLVKIMVKIGQVIEKLSKGAGLAELAKNEKIMSMLENMKGFVPKVGELLENIKSGVKKGRKVVAQKAKDTFPNTMSILSEKKSGIPKVRPEDIWNKMDKYIEILTSPQNFQK